MMEMMFFFLMIGALNKYLRYLNSSSGISPYSLGFCCWFSLDRFVKPTSGFTLTLSTRCCLGFLHSVTLIMHVGFPFIFVIWVGWVYFSRQPQVSSFSLKRGCSQSTSPQGGFMLLLSIRLPNRIIRWSKGMVGLWAWQRTLVPDMARLVSEFEASMTTEVEV